MKPAQARLTSNFNFTNIFEEVIEIKKGTIFTVLESDTYTQTNERNLIWQCGKGKSDFALIKIPKVFLADYDGEKVRRAISGKNNK